MKNYWLVTKKALLYNCKEKRKEEIKMKLKAYEDRYSYTVRGENFEKGFESLIIELSKGVECDYTIYIDTEEKDIDAIPSCYYSGLPKTYYGINVAVMDWKAYDHSVSECYSYEELEDYMTEDEKKELRKKFEEEKGYSEDCFGDKEYFYSDYASDYKYFLLDAGNKNIDEGVENFIKESISGYREQFDENYREILEDEED